MNTSENSPTEKSENDALLNYMAKCEDEKESIRLKYKTLLALIGHDIKSPMGAMIGFLTLIKDGRTKMSEAKLASNIEILLASAQRTYHVLEDLLEWAISDKVLSQCSPEYINLSELVNEEMENIHFTSDAKNIKIITILNKNEMVYFDPIMLKTVIRNLLSNAIKYSFEHSEIEISSKSKNKLVEISVKDWGVGVSKEMQKIMFSENGYNSTLGTNYEAGTGFGLMLCKELINMNNGKIWIISELGKGSELKFTLPTSESA